MTRNRLTTAFMRTQSKTKPWYKWICLIVPNSATNIAEFKISASVCIQFYSAKTKTFILDLFGRGIITCWWSVCNDKFSCRTCSGAGGRIWTLLQQWNLDLLIKSHDSPGGMTPGSCKSRAVASLLCSSWDSRSGLESGNSFLREKMKKRENSFIQILKLNRLIYKS